MTIIFAIIFTLLQMFATCSVNYPKGNNHGTLVGGAQIVKGGCFDRALSVDGDGDYVEITDNPTLEPGIEDFSISAYVNSNDITGQKVIFSKWGSAGARSYKLALVDGVPVFSVSYDGTAITQMSSPDAIAADTWVRVEVKRTGSTITLLTQHQADVSTAYADVIYDSTAPALIGAAWAVGEQGFFSGIVDKVRIARAPSTPMVEGETVYSYNSDNQLTAEATIDFTRGYTYDSDGNCKRIDTAGVGAEDMTYDSLGRMLSYTSPAGSSSHTNA